MPLRSITLACSMSMAKEESRKTCLDPSSGFVSQPPKVFPKPNAFAADLILSDVLDQQVRAELFTPIVDQAAVAAQGAGGSRGVSAAHRS